MAAASDQPTIVYVGDPMCSWCWGFAPVVEQLVANHDLGFRLIVGGLRPGPAAKALSDDTKSFILHHWDSVARLSGQPFDAAAFASRPPTWMYDTELPAVAVVAMRTLHPDHELPFFLRLQRAFYAEGIDITNVAEYPALLDAGIDVHGFLAALEDEQIKHAAWQDFAEARRLGAHGFPTTLLRVGDQHRMLATGYQPYEQVDQILHAALDRHAPAAAAGATCAVGEPC